VQLLQEKLIVGAVEVDAGEVGWSGEALRPDAGTAAQRIDAQSRVVGQYRASCEVREMTGFRESILLEGFEYLDRLLLRRFGNARLVEIDDLEAGDLASHPDDLPQLMGASGCYHQPR